MPAIKPETDLQTPIYVFRLLDHGMAYVVAANVLSVLSQLNILKTMNLRLLLFITIS